MERRKTTGVQDAGVHVSLFLNPDPAQIDVGAEICADAIELHTGAYAHASAQHTECEELDTLLAGQNKIYEAGLSERKAIVHILGIIETRSEVRHKEIYNLASRLQKWARRVEQTGLPADPELRQAIAQLAAPVDESMGLNHYVEATLPLVPGILAYKFEFASESR